jgi:hypothetical protein
MLKKEIKKKLNIQKDKNKIPIVRKKNNLSMSRLTHQTHGSGY